MRKGRFLSWCAGVFVALGGVATAQSAATAPKPPAFSPPPESPKQYSVAEIGSMFERPKNSQDLLKNLKLAMDKDLLLQKAFFDDGNLLKFFNGTRIEWEKPDRYAQHQHWANISTDDRAFERRAIRVLESRWSDPARTAPDDSQTKLKTKVAGEIHVQLDAVAPVTARDVMNVFGTPTAKEFDTGELTEGYTRARIAKGKYVYDVLWSAFGKRYFQKRVVVYFRLDPLPEPRAPATRTKFTDNDVVKSIELYEME